MKVVSPIGSWGSMVAAQRSHSIVKVNDSRGVNEVRELWRPWTCACMI